MAKAKMMCLQRTSHVQRAGRPQAHRHHHACYTALVFPGTSFFLATANQFSSGKIKLRDFRPPRPHFSSRRQCESLPDPLRRYPAYGRCLARSRSRAAAQAMQLARPWPSTLARLSRNETWTGSPTAAALTAAATMGPVTSAVDVSETP